jgi:hypothetical protein
MPLVQQVRRADRPGRQYGVELAVGQKLTRFMWTVCSEGCGDSRPNDIRSNQVLTGVASWRALRPIRDPRLVGDAIVVMYDQFAGLSSHRFQNLEGFSPGGCRIWTTKRPTTEAADSLSAFLDDVGLVATNFAGHVCAIDPAPGCLLSAEFTK